MKKKLRIKQLKRGPLTWTSTWNRALQAWGCWALAVLLLVALAGPAAGPADAAGGPRVLPQLLQEASRQPGKSFRVIVTRANRDTAADRYVLAGGHKKLKEVAAESFVAEVKGKDIAALGSHRAVKWVTLDAPMVPTGGVDSSKLATLYDLAIGAPALWSPPSGSDVTGEGIGVAVLDTGINQTLSDFKDGSSKRVVKQILFNSNTTNLNDAHGHGTHVAGIVAGNSWWSSISSVQGKYIGIAPRANLISVKVSDDQGMSYISDVVNGIDWVINNRQTYNIRVMNLSLLSSVAESYTTSILDAAVERAWFNGIFVVVSAGNGGPGTMLYPPANDPFVVTVGAADPMGTAARGDDTIAPWSSYGPTQDGFAKPDAVAPGRYIVSTLASSNATLAKAYPDRIVDGSYLRLSGTSMAAPVVAGLAALAFQAHPEWTNDQVKWLLAQTATRLGTSSQTGSFTPYPGQGAGEVDASKAVTYSGTPGYANQGLIISSLLVGPGGATTYSTSSWSTSSWSTSSWSTSSWSTSSWSTSSWSTANTTATSWQTAVVDN